MTVEGIIKQLASHLAGIGFISKSGALAQVSNVASGAGTGVMVSAQVHPFNTGQMVSISPDKKESGIAFWRASPTRITNQNPWLHQQENELILTVWANGVKTKHGPDTDFIQLVRNHFHNYRVNLEPGSPIRTANLEFQTDSFGENVAGYGWDDSVLRYHEAPNQLFQIRFRLYLTVGKGCSTPTVNVVNPAC